MKFLHSLLILVCAAASLSLRGMEPRPNWALADSTREKTEQEAHRARAAEIAESELKETDLAQRDRIVGDTYMYCYDSNSFLNFKPLVQSWVDNTSCLKRIRNRQKKSGGKSWYEEIAYKVGHAVVTGASEAAAAQAVQRLPAIREEATALTRALVEQGGAMAGLALVEARATGTELIDHALDEAHAHAKTLGKQTKKSILRTIVPAVVIVGGAVGVTIYAAYRWRESIRTLEAKQITSKLDSLAQLVKKRFSKLPA